MTQSDKELNQIQRSTYKVKIKSMAILNRFKNNKLYVDLIDPTTRRKDMPKFNILLKLFSLNPSAQKIYIMHHKAMMIANLVYISVQPSTIIYKS